MSRDLRLVNRQKFRPVDLALLRQATHWLLSEALELADYDLTVNLVGSARMALVNEKHLGHEGPTDVITLDYGSVGEALTGELFICLEVAVEQANRFRTTWESELVRYAVHGVLHLRGHDDLQPAARKRMKAAETRLLRGMARRFDLAKLARQVR